MPLFERLSFVFAINFISAFIQGTAGLGYAMIAVTGMSMFLPTPFCSAITSAAATVIGLQMTITLQKELKLKKILLPVLCCFLTINLGLKLLYTFDEFLLRLILASVLLLMTGIFLLMKRKSVVLPNRWYTAVGMGLLSGVSNGLFNIAGPFLMAYYINICENTLELKACLECSFFLTGLYTTFMHAFVYGKIGLSALPEISVSVIAVILAGSIGLKQYRKIDKEKLKTIVYSILLVMAAVLVIRGLPLTGK